MRKVILDASEGKPALQYTRQRLDNVTCQICSRTFNEHTNEELLDHIRQANERSK